MSNCFPTSSGLSPRVPCTVRLSRVVISWCQDSSDWEQLARWLTCPSAEQKSLVGKNGKSSVCRTYERVVSDWKRPCAWLFLIGSTAFKVAVDYDGVCNLLYSVSLFIWHVSTRLHIYSFLFITLSQVWCFQNPCSVWG